MSRWLSIAGLSVVWVGLWWVPSEALAHGRFPATGQIVFHPSDPDVIVVRATFGLVITRDGGETWRWVCGTVAGARMTEDPVVVVTPDGAIVEAIFDGVSRSVDDGCGFEFPDADLTDVVVIDQTVSPTDPGTLLAVTSSSGVDNLVYRSTDRGRTWDPAGDPIEPILFEKIRVAPSDPMRVYLSGSYPPTMDTARQPYVHRSVDGAATFERIAFTDFGTNDRNIYLLGVDPNDPDHVLMRVKSEDDDRLVASHDGGDTWTTVITMPNLLGFAWSADGTTAWAGGDMGSGLWRSDDGGETFTQIDPAVEIGCLAVHDGELWACGNNFTDGFAVGRSTDAGETFEEVLLFAEIGGMLECPPDSQTSTVCAAEYPDLVFDLGLPLDAGVARDGGPMGFDGGAGPDAGTGPGDDGGGGGCSCDAGGRGGSADFPPVVTALLILVAIRRRRRLG